MGMEGVSARESAGATRASFPSKMEHFWSRAFTQGGLSRAGTTQPRSLRSRPLLQTARVHTLYRHFPTREALFEAVYRHEVDQLFTFAQNPSRSADPVDGLRKWLKANVRLVATKKGMVEALQLGAHGSLELKTYSFDRLTTAIALLLDRGVAAGVFRSDVSPEELLHALVGIFYSQSAEKWQSGALRLVNVFVDGLCRSTSPGVPRRQ